MGKYWQHFKTVCKHKHEVFRECASCGIWWQGLLHDLSKFGITEFASSAKHFQGNRSPIEAEKEEIGYSKAWLHHKGHNKHHWEYWTDFTDDGVIIANKMPANYVIEMVCDWIGAGKVYNKDKWTTDSPMIHYIKMRPGRYFHPDTDALILDCLNIIKHEGLVAYHRFARKVIRSGY
jgi:hypothetical protein